MSMVHGDRHGLLLCECSLGVRLKTRRWTTLYNCIFILHRSLITGRVFRYYICSDNTNNSLMFAANKQWSLE